jgi:hypothetical protein
MALAVDSEMPSGVGAFATNASALSFGFNNVAGTLLTVQAACGNTAGLAGVLSTITYNSVSLGSPDVSIGWGTGSDMVGIWHLESPPTGTNTVIVTTSEVCLEIIAGCISLTGENPFNPVINEQSAKLDTSNGTTPTVTVPGTTSGNIVVDCMGTGTLETANGQTLSWLKNVDSLSGGGNAASQRAAGTGGAVVMSYTVASDWWGICAAEIAAAPAAGDAGTLGFSPIPFGQL